MAGFLVMKAHAIGGRDKPKDTYDFCYCLEHFPAGMTELAERWKNRAREENIAKAIEILREKFASVDDYGPQQLVEFILRLTRTLRRCTPGEPTSSCVNF